jgi:hypothetical protein
VLPAAQTVEPVYPEPPHCPYFATVPPVAVAIVELEVFVALLVVVEVNALLVVTTEVEELVAGVVACVVSELDVFGLEPPAADCPLHTAGPGTV